MPEINLLPDELRGKEEKELKSVRKKPKRIRIDMSSPQRDVVEQPLKQARPSLMSRLFAKKTKPGAKIAADPERVKPKIIDSSTRAVEKIIHIPKAKGGGKLSLSRGDKSSMIGVVGEETAEVDDERASSFITEADGTAEKVKISKRSEKVIEDIKKSPGRKYGFLLNLFGKDKGKKKKSGKSPDSKEYKKDSRLKPASDNKVRGTVLDINLIPEELNKHPELEIGKKLFASGVVISIFSLLILAGYFGILWYQSSIFKEAQEIEERIKSIDAQIVDFESNRVEAEEFQEYLVLVKQLLNGHVYLSKFFDKLEEHTSKEVFYNNFSMTGTEELTISAVSKDYQAIAEQLVAFQEADDFVQEVRINSATAVIDEEDGIYLGVEFTINLDFIPGIFLNKIDLP